MVDLSIRPEQAPKPYMTVIPARFPRQKLHATLGQAKNAASYFTYHSHGRYVDAGNGDKRYVYDTHFGCDVAIYKWNGAIEEWYLLYELHPGDEVPWRQK